MDTKNISSDKDTVDVSMMKVVEYVGWGSVSEMSRGLLQLQNGRMWIL